MIHRPYEGKLTRSWKGMNAVEYTPATFYFTISVCTGPYFPYTNLYVDYGTLELPWHVFGYAFVSETSRTPHLMLLSWCNEKTGSDIRRDVQEKRRHNFHVLLGGRKLDIERIEPRIKV